MGAMRALGLEPRTQGLKVHGATNENIGSNEVGERQEQQSELKDLQNTAIPDEKTMCLTVAIDSVRKSRQAVEKLLETISMDDHYSMGILGPKYTSRASPMSL